MSYSSDSLLHTMAYAHWSQRVCLLRCLFAGNKFRVNSPRRLALDVFAFIESSGHNTAYYPPFSLQGPNTGLNITLFQSSSVYVAWKLLEKCKDEHTRAVNTWSIICLLRLVCFMLHQCVSHYTWGPNEDSFQVVQFEKEHFACFEQFSAGSNSSFAEHIAAMSAPGRWGTAVELFAVATLLTSDVWTFYGGKWLVYRPRFRVRPDGSMLGSW